MADKDQKPDSAPAAKASGEKPVVYIVNGKKVDANGKPVRG